MPFRWIAFLHGLSSFFEVLATVAVCFVRRPFPSSPVYVNIPPVTRPTRGNHTWASRSFGADSLTVQPAELKKHCHALFLYVRRLAPPERVQHFMSLEHALRCVDKTAELDPKEGHFWQVDHCLPVVEGGGACGLENLRTLCTPCHAKETALLRGRGREGRMGKAAEGTRDNRSFIGGGGGGKEGGKEG